MPDPSEFVWEEAKRLLARQEANLDGLRVRALGVLSAGGLVLGVLLSHSHRTWAGELALGALAVSAALVVMIQWPRSFDFSHDLAPMLARVKAGPDASEGARALDVTYNWARDLDEDRKNNKSRIDKLAGLFTATCICFAVEVTAAVVAVRV